MDKKTTLLLVSVALAASATAIAVYSLKKKQVSRKKIAIRFF